MYYIKSHVAPRNALLDNPTVSCGSSVENLAVAGTLDFTVVLEGAPDAEELSVAPSIFLNIEDERVKFVSSNSTLIQL